MFGIGQPELLIIVFILLLLFGPSSLPKLAKTLGESIKSLKDGVAGGNSDKSFKEIADEVTNSAKEIRSSISEIKNAVSLNTPMNTTDEAANSTNEPKDSISEVNPASSVHKDLMSQLKDA